MPPLYFFLFVFAPSFAVMAFFFTRCFKTLRHFATVESQAVSGGYDAARRVLDGFHLFDIQVRNAGEKEKNRYRISEKTVLLGARSYNGRSFTAIAEALHLAGYAIQHMRGESRLWAKQFLHPVIRVGGTVSLVLIPLSLIPATRFVYPAGAFLFTAYMLSVFFLLPLELNSSRIVYGKLAEEGVFSGQELKLIQKALAAVSLEKVTGLCTGI
jgi:Zn-dependent membrane protease YugP